MTRKEMNEFSLGSHVGFWGTSCTVKSYWESKEEEPAERTYGIVIVSPQKETEVIKKARPKEYLITDAKMVLKV